MTSIIDRHATDDQFTHECGGTILTVGSGDQEHSYCDRCGAFRYTTYSGPFPTGTDKDANDRAWNDGDECSPPGIFGRLNDDGNVMVLYTEDGVAVTSLDANVYPVGSNLSARYEHVDGIVLSREDADQLGIEIEDA